MEWTTKHVRYALERPYLSAAKVREAMLEDLGSAPTGATINNWRRKHGVPRAYAKGWGKEAAALWDEGLTVSEISERMGLLGGPSHPETIRRRLRDEGRDIRSRKRYINKSVRAEILAAVDRGDPYRDIGIRYGRSEHSVRWIARSARG